MGEYVKKVEFRIPKGLDEDMNYILNNIDALSGYDPTMKNVKNRSNLTRAAIDKLGEDKKSILDNLDKY